MTDLTMSCASCGLPVGDPELAELCDQCAIKYGLLECECHHHETSECRCLTACEHWDNCPAAYMDWLLTVDLPSTGSTPPAERQRG